MNGYFKIIPEVIKSQYEALNVQLVKTEDTILTATIEEAKAQLITEAYAIHAKIIALRPDVRHSCGYNPEAEAQNRIYDAQVCK